MVSAQRIKRLDERDKVTWDQTSSLVNQLIERMLTVGSRLAPVDRSCRVIYLGPIEPDVFPVALHGELLQVGREAFQVLLVGQNRNGFSTKKVIVPHGQKPKENRQILLERRGPEVLVHFVESLEHSAKVVGSNG